MKTLAAGITLFALGVGGGRGTSKRGETRNVRCFDPGGKERSALSGVYGSPCIAAGSSVMITPTPQLASSSALAR